MHPATKNALCAAAIALLAGCAGVPFDYPKTPSNAPPPSMDTALGKAALVWAEANPGASAFYTLGDGMAALGTRLHLMDRAERSIDAQYFLIKRDAAGGLFAGKMIRAADRGVRVRFLVDDIFTSGLDSELALIASHPNIEVRMFNPLSRQGAKSLNLLLDFKRANRRMHNKSFTVDGAVTVIGGRNIADEYFQINTDVEFADFELVGFGPVAAQVSTTFDEFWNSARAVPIEAFGEAVAPSDLDTARTGMAAAIADPAGPYRRALQSPVLNDILTRKTKPVISPVDIVTDRPEKLENTVSDEHKTLVAELVRVMDGARREVIVVTPYFVPRVGGTDYFSGLRAKGVRVVVITNSLASTNHVAVHSGYARYRRPLLEAGVELHEVKADSVDLDVEPGATVPERLTLHSKAVIVDREILFVGSLNLDPRSIDLNTEMGAFVYSPELAGWLAGQLDEAMPKYTYRVELDDDGQLRWAYGVPGAARIESSEPGAGFGRKFSAGFYGMLPIEGQL